jgi:ubiquinone/menaquinone biosynthesis C-methylase UbiE
MVDLRQRATDSELLDTGVPDEEALRSLADLRFVNRFLGNARAFNRTVASLVEDVLHPRLLDVGCGSADVPARLAVQLGRPVSVVGVDLKLLHLQAAPADIHRVVADVRALPFAPASFDVVTASLFLHHFDAPELPAVLRALFSLCRRGLVVNDLHRARIPYVFGQATFRLLFRSQVSVEDGLVSIRRSFRASELREGFLAAGIPQVEIRRTWPYRLLATARVGVEPRA